MRTGLRIPHLRHRSRGGDRLTPTFLADIDWLQLCARLAVWRQLGPGVRRTYLEAEGDPRQMPREAYGDCAAELIDAGFLLPHFENSLVRVPPELVSFGEGLRCLRRNRFLQQPCLETFNDYLAGCGIDHEEDETALYRRVTDSEWVQRFLSSPELALRASPRLKAAWLPDDVIAERIRLLLNRVIECGAPVDILRSAPGCPNEELAAAISEAVHALLFLPGLDEDTCMPVIGIFPNVASRLGEDPPTPPTPRSAQRDFAAPLLIEDMTLLLQSCVNTPLRLRQDGGIYRRELIELAKRATEVPEWLRERVSFDPESRLTESIEWLKDLEMAVQVPTGGSAHLQAADFGKRWLLLPISERIQEVIVLLRKRSKGYLGPQERALLPWKLRLRTQGPKPDVLESALHCFRTLQADRHYSLRAFALYHSRASNPLLRLKRRSSSFALSLNWKTYFNSSSEQIEKIWSNLLVEFVQHRLAPLGAVRLGIDGDEICFALTAVGRYILGESSQLEASEPPERGILVQPNFEVIFLAPSALDESEIGRYADRLGQGLGVVFRITKRSVLRAVGAGMTGRGILDSLCRTASAVPANVRGEILDWAGQCRKALSRRALLVECPDELAAGRILNALKGKAKALNATTVEILDDSPRILRRLRSEGIFVETSES